MFRSPSASSLHGRNTAAPALAVALAMVAAAATPSRLAVAQDQPVPLARLTGPVQLDGMPDEPAWAAVEPLPMTMYTPTFQGQLTERTDIRVAYDATHLYVGARLYDSDPEGIRTNTLYRDQYSGDDLIAIVLDSYNDRETAVWFVINPAGVRQDRTVSNDGEFRNGMPMNFDWNTFWDAATGRTAEGWTAEMRIPFSSMGFQAADGRVVMGLISYRFIARKNERQVYPAIPPNWGLGFAKPSQAQRVVLEGVYGRRPIYVTPYALGGLDQTPVLDTTALRYITEDDLTREVGLDIRHNLTNNLALDLTANTDFAQVEVDDQQLNFTRFSLFFPEKRQFFQERAAVFEFNTGGFSRLFHSRRIGLIGGEPIRIYGGARLVGRVGGLDVGLLNMQTAETAASPSENFGVLRVRQQVFNAYSTVGGMATTRLGADGSYNVAGGVDALVRTWGDDYVTAKWAQSWERGVETTLGDLDATLLLLRWERRHDVGLSYAVEGMRVGDEFNPGVGFTQRRGFRSGDVNLRYGWLFGARSPFRTLSVSARGGAFLRLADGTTESGVVEPSVRFELKSGHELDIQASRLYESVTDSFFVAGVTPVPPGLYWYTEGRVNFMAARSGQFRPSWTLSGGEFYDGWRAGLEVRPAWNPSRHVELSAEYGFNLVRFPDRDESLDVHLGRLRVQLAFDVHLSVATFVQYNSATDDVGVNARLRYNFSEGRDLWLVYDESMNTDRAFLAGAPRPPLTQRRAFALKYTHTLIW
jgi:hypothetical protein